jgi:hypothetical protein
MKRINNFLIGAMILLGAHAAIAQSPAQVDQSGRPYNKQRPDDRMGRDIAVAENVLSTLIKQEFDQRNFFFMEVQGNYISGYGVTFTVPTSMLNSSIWSGGTEVTISDGYVNLGGINTTDAASVYEHAAVAERETEEAKKAMKSAGKEEQKAQKERNKAEQTRQAQKEPEYPERDLRERQVYGIGTTLGGVQTINTRGRGKYYNADSINAVNNAKVINAAKNFIVDYGDMLSQLTPEERVIVTNRGNGENQIWYNGQKSKRSLITVEATKGDLTQFRQGKLTREQLMAKIKVINTVSSQKTEPDMELLTSIFNRLYRSDLSRTYYIESETYYERLTDFGTILHMRVVSSISSNDYYNNNQNRDVRLTMPTQGLSNLTQEERDKKVKELYPLFESELKENVLEYGRTLKSLKDTEQLMVNVTMTKCQGCGIPATLELAVKASVLNDFNAGKLDKSAALSKIEVKKGAAQ